MARLVHTPASPGGIPGTGPLPCYGGREASTGAETSPGGRFTKRPPCRLRDRSGPARLAEAASKARL